MACNITVLGDSSSSGIGLGRDCYPAKLADALGGELAVDVVNCAVPGLTSADASRFFQAVAADRALDYLVVYLGNNEGAAGPHKGYYSAIRARIAGSFTQAPEPLFRPVLSPPRFRFTYDVSAQTIAITPEEFRDNLRAIIRRAITRGARVILLNPVANRLFPCGIGVANGTYFCYLDQFDRLGNPVVNHPVDEASAALAAGLKYFTDGRFDEAIDRWQPLVELKDVVGFIARHDVACAAASMTDSSAESQLEALLGEYDSYDSTVLYNLATLKKWRGDEELARQLLDAAFDKDTSVYRIRHEYRAVIDGFRSTPSVRVLDLQPILKLSHFVDYCHPTDEGHDAIARAVAGLIRSDDRAHRAPEVSRYNVSFPTPDYVNKPGQTLLDYYCIDWPISQDRITAAIVAAGRTDAATDERESGDGIDRCVANFLRANDQHPVFTGHLNLLGAWMPRSHEILSFPEQFLYRVLYNYSVAFEAEDLAGRLSAAGRLEPVRLSSAAYRRIIMRAADDDLRTELDVTREYFDAIVNKIGHQLTSADLMYRVTIGQRVRSVLTWFTREAFRYGTQSRMSMLYARLDIEKIVEGLIVAIVIAARRGDYSAIEPLDELLGHVLSLLQVHEQHVRRYHRDATSFAVGEYEADLADVERAIKAHVAA